MRSLKVRTCCLARDLTCGVRVSCHLALAHEAGLAQPAVFVSRSRVVARISPAVAVKLCLRWYVHATERPALCVKGAARWPNSKDAPATPRCVPSPPANQSELGRDPTRAALGLSTLNSLLALTTLHGFGGEPRSRPGAPSLAPRRLPLAPSHSVDAAGSGDPTPRCRGTLAPFQVGAGPGPDPATNRRAPRSPDSPPFKLQ